MYFHNLDATFSSVRLSDAVLSSAAAPTYFPPHNNFIDGGVFANNPCVTALAVLSRVGAVKLTDVTMLSLSTGRAVEALTSKDSSWGIAQWGAPLMDIIFSASQADATNSASAFLGDNFFRLDPVIDPWIPLDAGLRVEQAVEQGRAVDVGETAKWLRRAWTQS